MDASFTPFGAGLRPGHALIFLLSALGAACAAPLPQKLVGVSDAVPELPSTARAPAAGSSRSDFAAALAWPEAGPALRSLVHRRDGASIHVRIDPAVPGALAAYRALSTESVMPEGARVVAWHEAATGAVLDGYLLEKRAGAWLALAVDARGAVIPGDRAPCVRCHDMAPTDHLFGAPAALLDETGGESIDRASR